jgi:hypothetical protein
MGRWTLRRGITRWASANEPKIRATTQQNARRRAAGIVSRGVQVLLLGHKEVQEVQQEKDRRFFHSFPLFSIGL